MKINRINFITSQIIFYFPFFPIFLLIHACLSHVCVILASKLMVINWNHVNMPVLCINLKIILIFIIFLKLIFKNIYIYMFVKITNENL